jgi:hypothetical protein
VFLVLSLADKPDRGDRLLRHCFGFLESETQELLLAASSMRLVLHVLRGRPSDLVIILAFQAANSSFTLRPTRDSNVINISRLNFSHLPRIKSETRD